MTPSGLLPSAAVDFLDSCSSRGSWGEVFLEAGARFEAHSDGGARTAGFHPTEGVALRERRPDGTTFAHTNSLSPAQIRALVAEFLPATTESGDDPELRLGEASPAPDERRRTRAEVRRLSDAARRAAAEFGAADVRLRFTRRWRTMRIATSDGTSADSVSAHTLVRVDLRHRDGTGLAKRALGPAAPELTEQAGRDLVAAAVADAGTGPAVVPPSGACPVVFLPSQAGLLLHEAIGHPLEADTALAGSALWQRRDRPFAGAPLEVAEDPSSAEAWVPAVVDEEGSPCRPVTLVAGGVVRDVVSDRETAAALGRSPTGHARRAAFSSPPMPRVRHTVVAAGADGDVVAGTTGGILVERILAADADPARGTFTVRVERGHRIRAGRPAGALADFTVRGDLDDFASLVAIGSSCEVGQAICGRAGHWLPISFAAPALGFGRLAVFGR